MSELLLFTLFILAFVHRSAGALLPLAPPSGYTPSTIPARFTARAGQPYSFPAGHNLSGFVLSLSGGRVFLTAPRGSNGTAAEPILFVDEWGRAYAETAPTPIQLYIDLSTSVLSHSPPDPAPLPPQAHILGFLHVGANPDRLLVVRRNVTGRGGGEVADPPPAVFMWAPYGGSWAACPEDEVAGGRYELVAKAAYWTGRNVSACGTVYLAALPI